MPLTADQILAGCLHAWAVLTCEGVWLGGGAKGFKTAGPPELLLLLPRFANKPFPSALPGLFIAILQILYSFGKASRQQSC